MTSFSTTTTNSGHARASLEIYLLGLVDFDSALFLQERLVYDISGRSDGQGALLLCEHPPLISVGREGSRSHIAADARELVSRQIEVRWLSRGGGCIAHAPGQLAVYSIVPLDRLGMGLTAYRRLLEDSVIDVCREFRTAAHRKPQQPGVWGRSGQLAHVAVAVRSWVAYHGLFLNVSPSLDILRLVQPGGDRSRVSSLESQRERATSMSKVRESIVRHLASRLGYERTHVYGGHPLLRRTTRRIHVGA